jgi:beta-aspartyl-peptidase (threonine type)
MIKVVMAKTVVDLMCAPGATPSRAAEEAIGILRSKAKGYGGVIALDPHGGIGIAFNTPRMARAYLTSSMRSPAVEV